MDEEDDSELRTEQIDDDDPFLDDVLAETQQFPQTSVKASLNQPCHSMIEEESSQQEEDNEDDDEDQDSKSNRGDDLELKAKKRVFVQDKEYVDSFSSSHKSKRERQ